MEGGEGGRWKFRESFVRSLFMGHRGHPFLRYRRGRHDGLPSACFFLLSPLFPSHDRKSKGGGKRERKRRCTECCRRKKPTPFPRRTTFSNESEKHFFPFHHTGLHYRHDGCESSSKRATEKSPDDCTLRTPPSWLPRSTHPSPLPSLLSPACGILFLPVLGDLFVR